MKKVLFSLFVFSAIAFGAQAQTCSKSCTAKPAAASASCHEGAASASTAEAAAKLASMDATIESRTCPVSGTVSYVRKETNKADGSVSFVNVNYDATTNTFVNVAPSQMQGHEGCGAKATSTNGKSCCSGGSSATGSKACCAEKGKSGKTSKG